MLERIALYIAILIFLGITVLVVWMNLWGRPR